MDNLSIFVIIFLIFLIILTAFKLYREIKYIKEEKIRSKEIFDMFTDKNNKK
ncbi:MAG: hypothetical protein ACQESN_06265 [Thermotogota bacterium]